MVGGGGPVGMLLNGCDVIVMVSMAVMGRHIGYRGESIDFVAGWGVDWKGRRARMEWIGVSLLQYFRLGRRDRQPHGMLGGGDGETFKQR